MTCNKWYREISVAEINLWKYDRKKYWLTKTEEQKDNEGEMDKFQNDRRQKEELERNYWVWYSVPTIC